MFLYLQRVYFLTKSDFLFGLVSLSSGEHTEFNHVHNADMHFGQVKFGTNI